MKPLRGLALALALAAPAMMIAQQAMQDAGQNKAQDGAKPQVLDRVIATVNGDVLLQSDVDQEMRFAALLPLQVLPGQDTPYAAAQRLIRRTLILQQMQEQAEPTSTPMEKVRQAIAELKTTIPACARYHCATAEGWDAFLKANGLTEQEVEERWSQRLAIERFIGLRFRTGIRISRPEVEQYYEKTLVPAMEAHHEKAPKLDTVSERIQQLLLEQHVNGMLSDWLKSLSTEGTVQILDPAYSRLPNGAEDGD